MCVSVCVFFPCRLPAVTWLQMAQNWGISEIKFAQFPLRKIGLITCVCVCAVCMCVCARACMHAGGKEWRVSTLVRVVFQTLKPHNLWYYQRGNGGGNERSKFYKNVLSKKYFLYMCMCVCLLNYLCNSEQFLQLKLTEHWLQGTFQKGLLQLFLSVTPKSHFTPNLINFKVIKPGIFFLVVSLYPH